jgi:transposase
MGHLLNADYRQDFLFPPSVENWVRDDHPVRLIRQLIDEAVEQGLFPRDEPECEDGRPQYAPSLLLKIWVYSYVLRYRSSRKAEWACKNVVPMVWLTSGLHPDHNTLARFWHAHKLRVREFFRMTTRVAMKLNMIGMVLHGVDGTKLQASGSTRRAMNRGQAQQLLERTEQIIAELEAAIAQEKDEVGDDSKLTEALKDRKNVKSAIESVLSTWCEAERKITLSEPDARMLIGAGMGYNAQAVVDAKAGIIVAEDLVRDANDQHQLVPMLDKVKEEFGRVADLSVADGGYNTAQSLGEAAVREYPVVVNRSADERKGEKDPYHASHFTYDEQNDQVICPQEKRLEFKRKARRKQGMHIRIYRNAAACAECPVRASCTEDRRGRVIEISEHHAAVVGNRSRRDTPDLKEQLKSRITFGERPFAVIKELLGFRRFRLRGLENAALEWSFVAGIQNLLRIAAAIGSLRPVLAS